MRKNFTPISDFTS